MASITKAFSFNVAFTSGIFPYTAEGGTWDFSTGAGTGLTSGQTTSQNSTNDTGGGLSAAVQIVRSGKSLTDGSPFIEWTGLWTDLGVPADATVTNVQMKYDWEQFLFTTGAAGVIGPDEYRTSASALLGTFSASAATPASTSVWATRTGTMLAVASGQQPAATTIKLRIGAIPKTGSSNSAIVRIGIDWVNVTVTYTAAAATPFYSQQGSLRNDPASIQNIGQAVKRGAYFCLGEKWARRRSGLIVPSAARSFAFA